VSQKSKGILEKLLKQANKDRLELLFQKFSKERRGATREEFFGMLLGGKVTILDLAYSAESDDNLA